MKGQSDTPSALQFRSPDVTAAVQPQRAVRLTQVRAALERLRGPLRGGNEFRTAVRDVLLVVSSSRGGSSIVAEILRRSRGLLHMRAEINPFLVLHGLAHPESKTDSDQLTDDHVDDRANAFAAELAWDCGRPREAAERNCWITDLAIRFQFQWPTLHIDRVAVERATTQIGPHDFVDPGRFYATLLDAMEREQTGFLANYYDLGSLGRRRGFKAPQGPPGELVVEEPPFVCIEPWEGATPEDWGRLPIVLKTPSNAYRLRFYRALFPNARLRVLHLTRNPAAAVNGLLDGWNYPCGFFSHRLGTTLDIQHYSDVSAWGQTWWNFDLPPGWAAHTNETLAEVCAFQWHSAHETILRDVRDLELGSTEYLRVTFEDLVGPPEIARATVTQIGRWLGLQDKDQLSTWTPDMPAMMATVPPRPRRWMDRADTLGPLLEQGDLVEMAERLGYGHNTDAWK